MGRTPRHELARYRPSVPVLDEPAWFAEWFAEAVPPLERGATGYTPLQLAAALGLGKDVVYRALHDSRIEGIRVSGKGWLIPRPAVRLWLVEANALNLA